MLETSSLTFSLTINVSAYNLADNTAITPYTNNAEVVLGYTDKNDGCDVFRLFA